MPSIFEIKYDSRILYNTQKFWKENSEFFYYVYKCITVKVLAHNVSNFCHTWENLSLLRETHN